MSSIASNVSGGGERANRWLIIGAAVLAVLTGVLIFAALSSFGSNDSSSKKSAAKGDSSVLVAVDSIAAGTKLTPEMFRVAQYAPADLVPDALTAPDAVVGQVTRVDILKGQQASRQQLGQTTDDKHADQLAFKIPDGKRAMAIGVSEISSIAGLLVPGDRVDVLVTIKEKQAQTGDQQFVRIQTVLQNVQVLARAKQEVNNVVTLGPDGKPLPTDDTKPDLAQRPEKVNADTPGSVTLALSPEEVQRVILADTLGDITLSLRKFGEDQTKKIDDLVVPVFGN